MSVWFFLVIIVVFNFYISFSQTDVGLWGHNGTVNTFLNGRYQYKGIYNLKPYYVMNDSDCRSPVYMYYMSTFKQWFIGSNLGNNNFYGRCKTSNIQTPDLCNRNWYLPKTLSNAYIQITSCPSIPCDSINVDMIGASNYCEGSFIKIHDNIYKKNNSNIYFYFNYKMFSWMCANHAISTSCGVSIYGRDISQSYPTVSNSQSFYLLWNNNQTVNVTCQASNPPAVQSQQYYIEQYCDAGCNTFHDGCNTCNCNNGTFSCSTLNNCTSSSTISNDRCCCIKRSVNSDYTRSSQACMNTHNIDDCQARRCVWQC